MTRTGVFLDAIEYKEVIDLVAKHYTMRIGLTRGQNIYETDQRPASARVQEIAKAKGLPDLEAGKSYGLTAERELVAP